ncbi:MAG: DUF1571 domain-containing protein [Phycisphaerales bacterium]|nr:DUF1571 domain-containing protein [Phycisphaerales bacterium]
MRFRSAFRSARWPAASLVMLSAGWGCAGPRSKAAPAPQVETASEATAGREASAQTNPVAFIRSAHARAAALSQYSIVLVRSERRGLLKQFKGPERIQCWFRRAPFSVRMKWLEQDVKYGECVFVLGQHDDRVRFVPRNGFLGLPPSVVAVDVQTPVVWGEARNPLTDFGLEKMLERTLRSIETAGEELAITYHGIVSLDDDAPRAHHLTLIYPPEKFPQNIQELFIDPETMLPLATRILNSDGRLDASYRYTQLDTTVRLSDDDFVLDAERTPPDDQRAENTSQ